MFTVHCPHHGTDVLLTERRIEGLDRVREGHRLRWRCWCGTSGSTVIPGRMTGRHRPPV